MRETRLRPLLHYLCCCVLSAGCCALTGCNVVGVFAQVLPVAGVAPAYPGLKGQSVAVMVWADRGSRVDFPTFQADVARGVTTKLNQLANPKDPKQKKKVPKELAGVDFLDPLAVIRFQENHPELESLPSTEIATRLGVTRVIYLEIYSFETHPNASIDLYKGTVGAKLEVLEVSSGPNGKTATVAYTNPELRTTWPDNRPEGIAGSDEVTGESVYRRTLDQFTANVAALFVTHDAK
jgi:hypothetical protein